MLLSLPECDPHLAAFGRRLRLAREARAVDVSWLADRTMVAKMTLSLAEQGRCRLTSADLHRVTNALRLPINFLVTDRDLRALKPFA